MRLVNHPFRLDSQRLLSYLTSMRVLTLAVTPAISTTFWNTIYFYTASAIDSATAGYYQQHAGNFNDMEGYVVHRNFDD